MEPIQGESRRIPRQATSGHRPLRSARLVMILTRSRPPRAHGRGSHQHEGVVPDAMAVSKSLGAGFPWGRGPGRPTSSCSTMPTFGGGPLRQPQDRIRAP